MDDPKEIDVAQPRRIRAVKRDPFRTAGASANVGRQIPHADKVPPSDPDRVGILITLHRFELAGVEVDERAVEIATKLTRWHTENLDRQRAADRLELQARQAENASRDCWVYYVRCGQLIKIGMTTNLASRFSALRPNEVLAVEPGGSERERAMHQKFAALRAGGEYFHPGPALQQHVMDLREQLGAPEWSRSIVPDGQDWLPRQPA